jgi:hypothetical protein
MRVSINQPIGRPAVILSPKPVGSAVHAHVVQRGASRDSALPPPRAPRAQRVVRASSLPPVRYVAKHLETHALLEPIERARHSTSRAHATLFPLFPAAVIALVPHAWRTYVRRRRAGRSAWPPPHRSSRALVYSVLRMVAYHFRLKSFTCVCNNP